MSFEKPLRDDTDAVESAANWSEATKNAPEYAKNLD
jgi:hypothetical protein